MVTTTERRTKGPVWKSKYKHPLCISFTPWKRVGLEVRPHDSPLVSQFTALGLAGVGVENHFYDDVVSENCIASIVRWNESDRLQRKHSSPDRGTIQAVSWRVWGKPRETWDSSCTTRPRFEPGMARNNVSAEQTDRHDDLAGSPADGAVRTCRRENLAWNH